MLFSLGNLTTTCIFHKQQCSNLGNIGVAPWDATDCKHSVAWIIVRTQRTAWINVSLCCMPVSHQFTSRYVISPEELLKRHIYFQHSTSDFSPHKHIVKMEHRICLFFLVMLNITIYRPDLKRGEFRSTGINTEILQTQVICSVQHACKFNTSK